MGESFHDIQVKDVMSKSLISAPPSITIFQAAHLMERGGVGAILVKKDGEPAGIITDRDFAIKIATQELSSDTTIDKVASYPLATINSNESIVSAAAMMSSKKIRKLAVTENSKVIGVITATDIVNQVGQ